MKRLINLSGTGGRAVLMLGEEAKLTPPRGELYLADRQGRVYPQASVPADTVGALVLEEGRIVLQGCLAGYSSALKKARTALLMGLSAKSGPDAPSSVQTQQPAPRQNSAVLLDILQKAAELFPAGEQPAPPPSQDAVLNPFPGEFPFSRWRRVEYPGTDRCYLEGEVRHRGADYVIHALPGDRRSCPPGYTRYLRARDGSGFWVRIRKKQSGQHKTKREG